MTRVIWIPNPLEPGSKHVLDAAPSGGVLDLASILHEVAAADPAGLRVWVNGALREVLDTRCVHVGAHDIVVVARTAEGTGVGEIVAQLVVSLVLSLVVNELLAPRPPRTNDKQDEGPTYGFGPIRSQREEGAPKQVVYGLIRSGGTIINEFIDHGGGTLPDAYNVQIAFGHGPIQSIGYVTANTPIDLPTATDDPGNELPRGLLIDGNVADNLEHVEAHVRLGTEEQLYMPAFSSIADNNAVDFELEAVADAAVNPGVRIINVATDSQGTQDALFDEYGVTFDLPEEADYCRITFSFPQGYYYVSGGNTFSRRWSATVRIIEMVGGLPVTTGGNFGDGYVRLQGPTFSYKSQQPFVSTFQFPLYDPQTYTPGTTGTSLVAGGGTGGTCSIASPAVPWTAGQIVDFLTIEAWAAFNRVDNLRGTVIRHAGTFGSETDGFKLAFESRTFTPVPGHQITRNVPVLTMWGAQIAEFHEGSPQALAVAPSFTFEDIGATEHHYAITYAYRASVDGINDRLRLYIDGQLVEEYLGDILLRASTSALRVGHVTNTSNNFDGRIDEVWYLRQERTSDQVYRDFNGGAGRIGAVSSAIQEDVERATFPPAEVIGGWHFDENSGANPQTVTSFDTNFGNSLTATNGITTNGTGIVSTPSNVANDTRRSLYRIEVARNIPDSDSQDSVDNGVKLVQVTGFADEKFTHPTVPVLGLRVRADQEVNSSVPQITALLQGVRCPTWDGEDALDPDLPKQWTRNPAWVSLDRLTNIDYGLGEFFRPGNIDVPSFQEWAEYCDEIIYNLLGGRRTGTAAASPTSVTITRLQYSASVSGDSRYDGRGRIRIFVSNVPPPDWARGKHVGWYGERTPDPGTPGEPFPDHNAASATDPGGYEIADVFPTGGTAYGVDVFWDRQDEGEPWPAETIPGTGYLDQYTTPNTYVGTYEGRMLRHTYDAVHDTSESDWESLQQIAGVGRGILLLDGSRVRAKINRARDPVGIVTMASVLEGTFEVDYGGPSERPNAYTVSFLDEDKRHENGTVYVEHESVQDPTNLSQLRNESITVRGITRRPAAARHGKWLVNLDQDIVRSGSFEASVDMLHYEVGDVLVVSHDVLDWGTSGRVESNSTATTSIKLDRELVIGATGTYYVDVAYPNANGYATAEIDESAGTYPAGTALTLLTALPFVPKKGARVVAYESAERFLVEIVHTRITENVTVGVRWVEYVASVYDDTVEDLDPVSSGDVQNATIDQTIPPLLSGVSAREIVRMNASNDDVPRVDVTWTIQPDGQRSTRSVALWYRRTEDDDTWTRIATVDAAAGRASVELPGLDVGSYVAIAAQGVSASGYARKPERCAAARLRLTGVGVRPGAPRSLTASYESGKVVYRIETGPRSAGCEHEIRRGSWLMGPVVAVLPPGATETTPTEDWATGAASADGLREHPTLYVRARSAAGRYSSEAATLEHDPVPSHGLDIREDLSLGVAPFFSDYVWEDHGGNWIGTGTIVGTLTDLVGAVNPDRSGGTQHLEFTSSALTASYTTAEQSVGVNIDRSWRPEWYHVEAVLICFQVHPTPISSSALVSSPEAARMTGEGPLDTVPGEPANCTSRIQIRAKELVPGTWGEWSDFRPGNYYGALFQFRVLLTRPNDSYNVRLDHFSQRFRRVNRTKWERGPADRFLSQGVFT